MSEQPYEQITISKEDADDIGEIWICKLITHCGASHGSGEARRLVTQGAVILNGNKVTDPALDMPILILHNSRLQVGPKKLFQILVKEAAKPSELSEGEKWAKFPATEVEDAMLHYLRFSTKPMSTDYIIRHLLTELIKQRAEISNLKATLNIED